MKTIFTLLLPVLVVIAGFAGYMFFKHESYLTSALMIVISHLSASVWIYRLGTKKAVYS